MGADRRSRERLSVSLPAALVRYVRSRAEFTKTTQSAVVADAIRLLRDRDIMEGLEEEARERG